MRMSRPTKCIVGHFWVPWVCQRILWAWNWAILVEARPSQLLSINLIAHVVWQPPVRCHVTCRADNLYDGWSCSTKEAGWHLLTVIGFTVIISRTDDR